PGSYKWVCHDIFQQLCLATGSNPPHFHVPPCEHLRANHEGINGRTDQDTALEVLRIINVEAKFNHPASERLFCCRIRSSAPRRPGTCGREEEGRHDQSNGLHPKIPFPCSSPGQPDPSP